MAKLSSAQKQALEWLYGVDVQEPRTNTLDSLVQKGFVDIDDDVFSLNSFGANVVKMMRGEL